MRRVFSEHLKNGGRIVAVMSEHAFFGQEAEARMFRAWLQDLGAQNEMVEHGAFLHTERPTSVACRIVVINKPLPKHDPLAEARQAYLKAIHSSSMDELRQAAKRLREVLD